MSTLEERFDKAEEIILKRSFRKNSGFEDSYYIFDYEPSKELYVRERIDFFKKKSEYLRAQRGRPRHYQPV